MRASINSMGVPREKSREGMGDSEQNLDALPELTLLSCASVRYPTENFPRRISPMARHDHIEDYHSPFPLHLSMHKGPQPELSDVLRLLAGGLGRLAR